VRWEALEILRDGNSRRLFIGQSVSFIGDGITPVALAFAVLGLGGSASSLGLVLAARGLALACLLLVGGVWADRLSPRQAMLLADVIRAAVMGVMPVLLIAGDAAPPAWYVLGPIVAERSLGGSSTFSNTVLETMLQRRIPGEALARVASYDWFAALAPVPIGLVLVSPVSGAIGIPATLWGAGIGIVAISAVLISVPSVRGLRSDDPIATQGF
jgi:hypothetical protein